MPCSLAPTSARALASSTSFGRLSIVRSVSPRATKSRSRRMMSPALSASAAPASLPYLRFAVGGPMDLPSHEGEVLYWLATSAGTLDQSSR